MSSSEEIVPDDREPPRNGLTYQQSAFCQAYADPTSPTFGNQGRSYMAAYPECGDLDQARSSAWRIMQTQKVKDEIERIRLQVRGATGLTKEDYVQMLMNRQDFLFERGEKGDAQAAASLLKLLGEASGFFVKKVEDVTPPERRLQGGEATARMILEQAERLARMRQPLRRIAEILPDDPPALPPGPTPQ